jgi:hypothetical protein
MVNVGGSSKLAVITIYDDNGREVPITPEMQKATEVYREIIQKVVDQHQGYYNSEKHGKYVSISNAGISYTKGTPPEASHTTAKTDELWNQLIYFVINPQFIDKWKVKIDLVDLERYQQMLPQDVVKHLDEIVKKRHAEVFEKKPQTYTDDERLVLQVFRSKATGPVTPEQEYTNLALLLTRLRDNLPTD